MTLLPQPCSRSPGRDSPRRREAPRCTPVFPSRFILLVYADAAIGYCVTLVQGYGGNKGKSGRRWPALALLCAAEFVVVGALAVVAIALPSIGEELGFSRSGLQWVISAYVLTFGGFLLPAGRAADLWGRRRVFVVGLALFSVASLVCGLSGSAALLIAARAAQGFGAALVTPAALSILTGVYPEGEGRSLAVGFWTAAQASGGASGWIAGGFLAQGPGWEWVFFATVPVGVFRSRELVGSGLVALAFQATTNAPLLLCILYLQEVASLSPARAGFAFVPFNLAVVAGSFLGSRLTGGMGARITAASGLLAIAVGVLLLVGIATGGGFLGVLLPGFVLMGVGVGLSAVASTTAGTSALGGEKRGLASGLLHASAEVGYVLGLALLVPLSAARTDSVAVSIVQPSDAALVEGFRLAFCAGAALAVLGALVALVLIRAKASDAGKLRAED